MTAACVVLLSGGQDSTTVLYEAKRLFGRVEALAINYGQRHVRELVSARVVADLASVPLHEAHVEFPKRLTSALTSAREIETRTDGLPSTFVAGRNVVFLGLAAGLAAELGAAAVAIGCSSVDYSGYPDCRADFLTAQEEACSLAVERPRLVIWAPLVVLSKAETVRLARANGAWEALAFSWTCYLGGDQPCGTCPACVLRAKGFAEAGEADPAL